MKITVGKQELQERVGSIQSIVEKRSTMPILSHFLLEVGEQGSMITATDIETAVKEPLEAQVSAPGRLCLPARKLFEIVKELEGDITLESEDAQWVSVSAGKSAFRIACLAPEEYPAWPELTDARTFSVEASVLLQMIEKTIYSSGESDTRYTLNGLLFHVKDGDLTVVGTDGHRLAYIRRAIPMVAEAEELKVIVPRKTASELRKFLSVEGDVTLVVGTNHVLLKIGEVEFLARLIEGSYPNYQQVIPSQNDRTVKIARETLVRSLRRVSVISRERSNAVKFEFQQGSIRLSASNPDLGEASDEVGAECEGEKLTIGYNARYMIEALQAIVGETVRIDLKDQLSPTLVREVDDDSYKCVVMPMRI